MTRLFPIFLGFLLLVCNGTTAWAASAKATALRQANGLTAYNPPEKFLAGNFVADEMNPGVHFRSGKGLRRLPQMPHGLAHRSGRPKSPGGSGSPDTPAEYSLFLEEDCPDKVVYYVFIDQSGLTPQQWIEWREKFHGKSKTDPEYSEAKSKLDTACTAGCGVGAELRFIQKDGELVAKSPEEVLRVDLKFAPIYDLNRQKKIPK